MAKEKFRPEYVTHVNFDADFTFPVASISYMTKGKTVSKVGRKNIVILNQQYQVELNDDEFEQLFDIWTSHLPMKGTYQLLAAEDEADWKSSTE